jgi:hypothetical protein
MRHASREEVLDWVIKVIVCWAFMAVSINIKNLPRVWFASNTASTIISKMVIVWTNERFRF